MSRPASPSYVAAVALAGQMFCVSVAHADPITAAVDSGISGCLAVNDGGSGGQGNVGAVRWIDGRAVWQWAQAPTVYVVCVGGPRNGGEPLTSLDASAPFGGVSPASLPVTALPYLQTDPLFAVTAPAPPGVWTGFDVFTLTPPPPWDVSRPTGEQASDEPVGLPLPAGSDGNALTPFTLTFAPRASSGVNAPADSATIGGTSLLNPPPEFPASLEMTPAPEPGSLLLVGTGLLAAWRAARRRS